MHALSELDIVLRLGVAGLLGALIGLERERLERAAGLRTHALVAVASALMMLVSAYSFPDIAATTRDPTRMAAQVVSGIGFLGAGVIIFRKNAVRGLTTAASIWTVAGIGLAAGAGMHVAAVVATGFILAIQAGLRPLERRLFVHHQDHRLVLRVRRGTGGLAVVERAVASTAVKVRGMRVRPTRGGLDDRVEIDLDTARPGAVTRLLDALPILEGVQVVSYTRGAVRLVPAEANDEAEGLGAEEEDISEYAGEGDARNGHPRR